MEDPIKTFVDSINEIILKLKNGINNKDRDDLEFSINDLNITISGMEYDYDYRCILLEKDKDNEYQKQKDNIKTDAGMKRHLESEFIDRQIALDKTEATLKYLKRLHSGYIRMAEHIKSNVIQNNVDTKRNGF